MNSLRTLVILRSMALTSGTKGTQGKEKLLQEILQRIENKKEELLKELELLNSIEAELKSMTSYSALANEPQPIKKTNEARNTRSCTMSNKLV